MTSTDDITPKSRVLVDGDFSTERLQILIKLGIEEERLDYKNEYNLSGSRGTKDKVELVRDIVGMANTYGGYIVLGVHEVTDSTGKRFSPDGMSQEACTSLDISALRQQIEAYVSERIEIQFKLHALGEFAGNTFGVIFVPPSPHSPIIFSNDGQYTDRSGPHNRNITLFCAGDIVVRKGASTEKADQSDMRRLISEIRQREKARWTEEILGMRDLVQRLDQLIAILSRGSFASSEEAQGITTSPSNSLDETLLYLSPSVIPESISTLLENSRSITVQRYISKAPGIFSQHIDNVDSNDDNEILETRDNRLWPILDGLVAIGVTCIEYKQWDLFDSIQQAFYRICYQAEKSKVIALSQPTSAIHKIKIWQEVMLRVYVLGGVLVHRTHWQQVKKLVQQEIEWDNYYRLHYWSRYILVMASRAGQLEKQGWIPPVTSYIEQQQWISQLFMSDKDQIINSVCQFDFLQCVYTSITDTGEIDVKKSYPGFGLYYKSRTEPIIVKIVIPGELRESISNLSDDQVAMLIRELDIKAAKAFMMYSGWDEWEWSDQRIKQFLADHPA